MSKTTTQEAPPVSKGLLITLGVVVALAATVGLWVFVLAPTGADDAELDGPVAQAPGPDDPDGGDDDGDDADDPADDAAGVEVVSARDPFDPLASADTGEDVAATPAGDPEAEADAEAAPAAPAPADGADDAGSDAGDDAQTRIGDSTLRLLAIYTGADDVERALIEVDATGYHPAAGESFAERFELVELVDDCATLSSGDARFRLCEGGGIRS